MNKSGKESLFLELSQAVLQEYKRRRGWRNAALGFSLAIIVKHGKGFQSGLPSPRVNSKGNHN